MPADFNVGIAAVTSGVWRVRASWTGRGISGLWLLDDGKKVLLKRVSSGPLELAFEVDERWVTSGRELAVRFATTTDRGDLEGVLEVLPPVTDDEVAAAVQAEAAASAVTGAGACLEPGFGDDLTGPALEQLARSLDHAEDGDAAISLGWARRLIERVSVVPGFRERRDTVDELWDEYMKARAQGPATDRALRALLSTFADLVRREGASRAPAAERRRQERFIEHLQCLLPPDRS